jgi:crotonobetainyl-CoA:carnitine CoA-transferase CaiB-like acyl-CoA transferase
MGEAPPLSGVRVLELSTGIAAQTAGMLLADLGAEVVRPVDDVEVDSAALPGWLCWNRGKTMVRNDGAAAEGAIEIRRLVHRADAVIADARPGELESRGLDSATLAATAPSLVHVWMPPIATGGRWSQLPHDDLFLDAVSGFAAHHPATGNQPVASVVPTRFHLHGAMGAGALVAGLLARERDGWGRASSVTGLQAVGAALCTLVTRSIDGPPVVTIGKAVTGSPQFRLYQAGDGRWLFLGALSIELFFTALEVLGRMDVMAREDVAGDFLNLMRPEIAGPVGEELAAVFATRPIDDWLAAFKEAGVPIAPLSAPNEWLEGEVMGAACPPVRRDHREVGEVTMPGLPVELSATPGQVGALAATAELSDIRGIWTDVEPRPAPDGPPPAVTALPLEGLKVVDIATFLAGPFVGSLLATHGAKVLKVETPVGDPYRVFTAPFAVVHEHKNTLRLDLRDADDKRAFLELVRLADVAIDNLLPRSFERLGLTADVFEKANPRLVRCSITAYGQEGAWAELPGFDPVLQTVSGLAAIQGGDGRPITTSAPVHDITTGAIGALGTLVALLVRERSGRGQRVFTSLAAVSTFLQSGELTTYEGCPSRAVGGADYPGPSAWRRLYRGSDRWLALSATTAAQRQSLLELIGRPDLAEADDPKRSEALAEIFLRDTVENWVTACAAVSVPACHVLEPAELDDSFLRDQRYSHELDAGEVGRLELIGGFTDWRGVPRRSPTEASEFEIDAPRALESWKP